MKKFLSFALAITMLGMLAGCGNTGGNSSTPPLPSSNAIASDSTENHAPRNVTITHKLGTVEVPFNPQNLVVLDLATLDILDNLGLGDRVTGMPKSSYVSYLKSYVDNDQIENLGSLKEVDMEAIYALKPEVIFIGGRLSAQYDELSKIAPVVLVTVDNQVGYMKTFQEYVMNVASIFGLEDKAQEKLQGFDQRIAALSSAAEGKNAIVGLVNSSSLSTIGSASRCSLISNEVGFDNLAADVNSTHGDSASFELLLEKNPDYIFILDRDTAIGSEGAKTAKEVMENQIVMKTNAYQNNQIIYLTPDVWYLSEGGITATHTMLQDLEKAILG